MNHQVFVRAWYIATLGSTPIAVSLDGCCHFPCVQVGGTSKNLYLPQVFVIYFSDEQIPVAKYLEIMPFHIFGSFTHFKGKIGQNGMKIPVLRCGSLRFLFRQFNDTPLLGERFGLGLETLILKGIVQIVQHGLPRQSVVGRRRRWIIARHRRLLYRLLYGLLYGLLRPLGLEVFNLIPPYPCHVLLRTVLFIERTL